VLFTYFKFGLLDRNSLLWRRLSWRICDIILRRTSGYDKTSTCSGNRLQLTSRASTILQLQKIHSQISSCWN